MGAPAQRAPQPPPLPKDPTQRRVARVTFQTYGPGAKGESVRPNVNPSRHLTSSQATLEPHALGVLVHGTMLVPWSNIAYLEYEA